MSIDSSAKFSLQHSLPTDTFLPITFSLVSSILLGLAIENSKRKTIEERNRKTRIES